MWDDWGLLILFAITLFIALIRAAAITSWRRSSRIGALASGLGLRFFKGGDGHAFMHRDFMDFHSFPEGRNHYVWNILGEADHAVFDCLYQSSENEQAARTLAVVRLGTQSLPSFKLRTKTDSRHFDIPDGFGESEIEFDGDRLFSDRFRLAADEDVDGVRALFDSKTRQQLTEHSEFSIEGGAKEWIIIHPLGGKLLKPEEFMTFLERAKRIARIFEQPPAV